MASPKPYATFRAAALTILATATSTAVANPQVSEAEVSFQQGQVQIAITGTDFGAQGPNVVVHDSFEDVSASDAQWTSGSPVIGNVARSGNNSHLGYNNADDGPYILRKDLGANYDEIYLSYWVKLGTSYFPGAGAAGPTSPNQFPNNSSWKFLWLMDGSQGYRGNDDFDMCIPTHTGNGSIRLAGNDGNFISVGNDWWSWNEWVRISTLIRKQSGDYGFWQTVSVEHGNEISEFGNNSPFFPGVTDTFSYITMPGWMRDSQEPVIVHYDDVYIAVGDGAPARIEIANASNYNNATVIDMAQPSSWSDGAISATVPASSGLATSGNGYLFVFDSSGQRNAVGYPLCSECPESPEPF